MDIKAEFDKAVSIVHSTKSNANTKLTDNDKLDMYKYYKQATVGDCNISEPWSIHFEAHAKWKAWNSIKGMSTEEAMQEYVNSYNSYML